MVALAVTSNVIALPSESSLVRRLAPTLRPCPPLPVGCTTARSLRG